MLCDFSTLSFTEIETKVENEATNELYYIVDNISVYIQKCIYTERLNLKAIKYHIIIDGMNKKEREIGVQNPLHQIFDYIAVEGMLPMLNAKIGVFQCASLPNKGQSYGKKYVERWIRESKTSYFAKGDIQKCFPSIPNSKLKEFIKRDIKNSKIYWLVCELIDMFKQGLSIGSYLSQYLCNYYLSYAYHFASEKLFKVRKTKRKGEVKIRLLNHVLFYMDDFLITGNSKKDVRKAMILLVKYFNEVLKLKVKPNWKVCKIDAEPIDMMGFVFRTNRTTIRAKIFLKTRRYFIKANKKIKNKQAIPLHLAYRCISAYGWYKHTDSRKIMEKLEMDTIIVKCKGVISLYNKNRKRCFI